MILDYKFWYVRRNDAGFITDCAIRLYEGDLVLTKYVRSKKLQLVDLNLTPIASKVVKDGANQDAFVFTTQDFGQIKTDLELRSYFNQQLATIATLTAHTIINEQKV